MIEDRDGDERPLGITDADVQGWPWLQQQVEKRDGAYYTRRGAGPHGDPQFGVHMLARRLGLQVRCVEGIYQIDLPELRRRIEDHHWLRHAEGFDWCPECGSELSGVGRLPPTLVRH